MTRRALRLLEGMGCVVEAEQVLQAWPVMLGPRRERILLRADCLVVWRGQRYVAEVKTGALVASLRHGPTRRQLLEYQVAYRVAGVLLVDVLSGSIEPVRFPGLDSATSE